MSILFIICVLLYVFWWVVVRWNEPVVDLFNNQLRGGGLHNTRVLRKRLLGGAKSEHLMFDQKRFIVVVNDGDGDCLFHALSNDGKSGKYVREDLYYANKRYFKDMKEMVAMPGDNPNEDVVLGTRRDYINKMRKPGVWGGLEDIEILARDRKWNVWVFQVGKPPNVYKYSESGTEKDDRYVVFRNEHYEKLILHNDGSYTKDGVLPVLNHS